MPNHIHLFVSAPPYIAPTEMVKTIKSISVTGVFRRFKNLKARRFWGSGLWSKGYYVNDPRLFGRGLVGETASLIDQPKSDMDYVS